MEIYNTIAIVHVVLNLISLNSQWSQSLIYNSSDIGTPRTSLLDLDRRFHFSFAGKFQEDVDLKARIWGGGGQGDPQKDILSICRYIWLLLCPNYLLQKFTSRWHNYCCHAQELKSTAYFTEELWNWRKNLAVVWNNFYVISWSWSSIFCDLIFILISLK